MDGWRMSDLLLSLIQDIIKRTEEKHPDHKNLVKALETMVTQNNTHTHTHTCTFCSTPHTISVSCRDTCYVHVHWLGNSK